MKFTERILIKQNDERIESLTNSCKNSKNLYNKVLYILRQNYFNELPFITYNKMDKILREQNDADFYALPSGTAQQVLKEVYKNWSSSWTKIKKYNKNPKIYNGRPRLPSYLNKDGLHQASFTYTQIHVDENGIIKFPKITGIKEIKTRLENLIYLQIIPKANSFVINIIYNKTINDLNLNKNNFISIDLGLNNIATQINNVGKSPFIISGKDLKNYNQGYNRIIGKLQSDLPKNQFSSERIRNINSRRYWYIQDKMHKISRYLINFCTDNNIGTIIIGYNKEIKTNINLGKKNNQNFVNIPFESLIEKIKYKAELQGIDLIMQEESYTSKCDALSLESIEKHEIYSGKRIKRGLFSSGSGKLINADINGAINIARNALGDKILGPLIQSGGIGYVPHRINI